MTDASAKTVKTSDDIFNILVECIKDVLPDLQDHAFKADDSLAELGANSVDRAEIVMMVLESLALNIPRTELFGPSNIGELASLLYAKYSKH